jgi:NADH-quinone oxidoreductase subunit I
VDFNKVVKTIFFTEILKGMALTFKSMLSRAVTRQYPKEKRYSEAGFRGLHALVRDTETGKERCVACGLCAVMCPSQCIHIRGGEDEDHHKVPERYDIDVLRCLFCALCVEACPFGAIVLTEHYEYAAYRRKDFYMTKDRLLENWDKYMAGEKGEAYLRNFWHPVADDYETHEGQAVFRGASGKESD